MINKTARTIDIEWTEIEDDADGYLVYVISDTDTMQRVQVVGNSVKVTDLRGSTIYNITVRAYQQLVGPLSMAITVETLEQSIVYVHGHA